MAICAQITNLTSDLSAFGGGSNDPVTGGQGITLSAQSLQDCTGYVLFTAQDYNSIEALSSVTLASIGIDPIQIAYVFSWGMGAVLSMWALGYATGVAVQLIKKI